MALTLSRPKTITFIISAVLGLLSLLVTYGSVAIPVVSGNAYLAMVIAWVVLLAGNLLREV